MTDFDEDMRIIAATLYEALKSLTQELDEMPVRTFITNGGDSFRKFLLARQNAQEILDISSILVDSNDRP